ncbi:C40 family peptidase [Ornithinibacillus xuwenensis]|uniref:LysM peptidoglycan-binding domain-containing protein n=1 Tax=Ornithinibacillus xuwenensis TaxID=3144668 RepID=A0ABU9XHA8_9BACI
MYRYYRHELRKTDNGDSYELYIYLDDHRMEFANELGTKPEENTGFVTSVKQMVKENYPRIKVSVVKVVIGGLAITSFPLIGGNISTAKAEEVKQPVATQVADSSSIYYQVSVGDTLWGISNKFHTTVANLKQANHLTSDALRLQQKLIIPQAFHTIEKGDYLSVLAREYDVTVDAIKAANGMTSDLVSLGQVLTIPTIIQGITTTNDAPIESNYTVVAGDSLWGIANRYNTTVTALKLINNLTSDTLRIGQMLRIPSGNAVADTSEEQVPAANMEYKVVAGDSLWSIAQRYGVHVDAIRSSNNLDSDNLRIGQKLIISKEESSTVSPSQTVVNSSHTVTSGDTLYSIAKRYNVTVEQLKSANQLTSNTISLGQVLKIPSKVETVNESLEDNTNTNATLQTIQRKLQILGYYAVPTITGSYDNATTAAIKDFQADYGLSITGKTDTATNMAIEHAVVKRELVKDTRNYLGVPYQWGGTSPSGFDCSGFVYYMFTKHGVNMERNTSSGLYTQGKAIATNNLQPGDLVFYSINASGSITHVGFYIGDNQWISATNSKGIAIYTMDNPYWSKYYVGAKRVY